MIKNFLFSLFFFSGIIFISFIFLPALLLPKNITLFGGKLMGYWSSLCLKIFLSTKIKIKVKKISLEIKNFYSILSPIMFETFFFKHYLIHQYLF